ncbi:MAG: hypothetical protein HY000_14850 [Planctomycetes bacterium]|nr:hypothetical protein [Planctomycetota bacterium]
MLTQVEADALMAMPKQFAHGGIINFPRAGEKASYEVISVDEREKFLFDVNRGRIRLSKCTYQERYKSIEILVRLDLDGPPHENPDGRVVPCPHIHLYREGYADKWAEPVPRGHFRDTSIVVATFKDFLAFCNVSNTPTIQPSLT